MWLIAKMVAIFHPSLCSHLFGNVTLQHLLLRSGVYTQAFGSRVTLWLTLQWNVGRDTLCQFWAQISKQTNKHLHTSAYFLGTLMPLWEQTCWMMTHKYSWQPPWLPHQLTASYLADTRVSLHVLVNYFCTQTTLKLSNIRMKQAKQFNSLV